MSNPGKPHWDALKYLFRYINGSVDIGLCYKRRYDNLYLVGYVDSDFAGDKDSRKSTTTYFFTLGGNCISWKSQLQPLVALSSTETEYMAITDAFKEAIWLQGLLREINLLQSKVVVFSDSQSAIHLCKNPVSTEENPTDVGTKILTAAKFKLCLSLLHNDVG
ncbi:secreted RxLR effector protein 161-like [Diospyros lotus]|uniref:secreted RxLR effector protein 161-like n=1 Tax=Diospyros lotus TaxID=55363 RepID=UPI00225C387C|nr:secreted RxLR effector protein 161-like [Diospyros lotus]